MDKKVEDLNENTLDIISRFSEVNKERNTLNKKITDYYTPLLEKAAKSKNKKEYDSLISELPDCPFLMTAYRIGALYGF